MGKLLRIVLLILFALCAITAHSSALPDDWDLPNQPTNPNQPKIPDWRKTPGVLRPAPPNMPDVPAPNDPDYKPSTKPKRVKVPFDVSKMGKYLGRTGLPLVAYELLGAATDYLLDPANNRVVITSNYDTCQYGGYTGTLTSIHSAECQRRNRDIIGKPSFYRSGSGNTQHYFKAWCAGGSDMIIICSAQPKTEVPLDELADRILDAARRGNPDARRWVEDWADDEIRINPKPYHDQVSSPDPNKNPNYDRKTGTDTNTDDNPSADVCETGYIKDADGVCVPKKESTEDEEGKKDDGLLPGFCDWAKTVCDWFDWTKEELQPPNGTHVPIDATDLGNFDKSYVDFVGQCPAPINYTLNIMGSNAKFSFSWDPICSVMIKLRPFIIFASYILATFIVGGFNRGVSNE